MPCGLRHFRPAEQSLAQQKREIRKKYLFTIKGYGAAVEKKDKDDLVKAVESLETEGQQYQNGIEGILTMYIGANVVSFVEGVFPAVKRAVPPDYTEIWGPITDDATLKEWLKKKLQRAFGDPARLISGMEVSLIFKDIAYESLIDEKFLKAAREAIIDIDSLYSEYDAAREADE